MRRIPLVPPSHVGDDSKENRSTETTAYNRWLTMKVKMPPRIPASRNRRWNFVFTQGEADDHELWSRGLTRLPIYFGAISRPSWEEASAAVAVEDRPNININMYFVVTNLVRGNKVLVHCAQGVDRSIAVVVCTVALFCSAPVCGRRTDGRV